MLQINPTQVSFDDDMVTIVGTLTPSGNYAAGGDTIDWTTVSGYQSPNGRIFSPAGLPTSGFVSGSTGDSYGAVAGAALNSGKVKINTASATELGAGAYPARITGDANIYFAYTFPRLL